MRTPASSCLSLLFVGLAVACGAEIPAADPVDAPAPDAPGVPETRVSGRSLDWFAPAAAAQVIGDATIELDGTRARLQASSDAAGSFSVTLPAGSVVVPVVSRAGFRRTRNPEALVLEAPLVRDLHVVADVQVTSLYLAAVGAPPVPGTAVVFADLRQNGLPMRGRPLAELALVTDANAPVPARGPFVVDDAGRVDLAATVTTATFGGRAVVTWLDCPRGTWRLAIGGVLLPHAVICEADGATIVDTRRPGEPLIPEVPTFTRDIYPRLGRPAFDPRGLACTVCHHTTAEAEGLVPIAYDGVPSVVYAALLARAEAQPAGEKIVDLQDPTRSLLLRRPLYEPPPGTQDHPNATFVDPRAFDYELVLRWLEVGAPE